PPVALSAGGTHGCSRNDICPGSPCACPSISCADHSDYHDLIHAGLASPPRQKKRPITLRYGLHLTSTSHCPWQCGHLAPSPQLGQVAPDKQIITGKASMPRIDDLSDAEFMNLQAEYGASLPICPICALEDVRHLLLELVAGDAVSDRVKNALGPVLYA